MIIIFAFVFGLAYMGDRYLDGDEEIVFIDGDKEFTIPSSSLKILTDPLKEGVYNLCSLKKEDKDNPCIPIQKVNLDG